MTITGITAAGAGSPSVGVTESVHLAARRWGMSEPREYWIIAGRMGHCDCIDNAPFESASEVVHVREVPESMINALQEAELRGFMRAVEMLRSKEANGQWIAFDKIGDSTPPTEWADWLEERKP